MRLNRGWGSTVFFLFLFSHMTACSSIDFKNTEPSLGLETGKKVSLTKIIGIGVRPEGNRSSVVAIKGDSPFEFTSYMREKVLSVEIAGAKSFLPSKVVRGNGELVEKVIVSTFERVETLRVEIHLKRECQYDMVVRDETLFITLVAVKGGTSDLVLKLKKTNATIVKLKNENVRLKGIISKYKKRAKKTDTSDEGGKKDENEDIKRMVHFWLEAWKSKDIMSFGSVYSESFYKQGKNLEEWLDEKTLKFERSQNIWADASGVEVSIVNDRAVVRFTQHYRADSYSDTGIKVLGLIREEEGWKIKSESWRPVK